MEIVRFERQQHDEGCGMAIINQRLLYVYDTASAGCVVFAMTDPDYDPAVGQLDSIDGCKFRVIRAAEIEKYGDGNDYWTVHALALADTYH